MFDTCFQLLITKKILLFVGPTDWLVQLLLLISFFFFSFFFSPQPPIPKLTKPRASYFFFFFFSFNPQYPNSLNPNCSQAPFTQKRRGLKRMRWIIAPIVDPNRSLGLSPSGFCFPTTPPNQTHLWSETTH